MYRVQTNLWSQTFCGLDGVQELIDQKDQEDNRTDLSAAEHLKMDVEELLADHCKLKTRIKPNAAIDHANSFKGQRKAT